jgi:putative inorganic carbon (hco3(-)) transporter
VFMFGILAFGLMSDLANGQIELGVDFVIDFAKVLLFYLLLVGIVDTPARLRLFLVWVSIIILIPTSLALLHYHKVIDIPAFDAMESDSFHLDLATGNLIKEYRLVATGMFGDPNDFSEIIVTGLLFAIAGLADMRRGMARLLWLAPIAAFGLALAGTRSRGGFLGTLAGLVILLWARFGLRKAILLAALALPLLFFLFQGRMTELDTSEGTGQGRITLWDDGFELLQRAPVFGIGAHQFVARVGRAAHNSFVCAYTELGVLGGSFYFAGYYYALLCLAQLGATKFTDLDPEVRRMRPYILAAVTAYAFSEMSLNHNYNLSTYALLGLATVCIRLADPESRLVGSRLDSRSFLRILGASALFLIALKVFIRFSVHY